MTTNLDTIEWMVSNAIDHRAKINRSIKQNARTNEHDGTNIPQEAIDAVLTDFINYCASTCGIDFDMDTRELSCVITATQVN